MSKSIIKISIIFIMFIIITNVVFAIENNIKSNDIDEKREVIFSDGAWRMAINGKIDYDYNGIGTNDAGTWLLENGQVTFKYNGSYKDENGDSWVVVRSAVQKNLTTVMLVDGAWRMVIDGKIDYNYEGIGKNNAGTWYVHEGMIDFKYNGSFSDDENTYLVEGNRVILSVPKDTNKVIQVNGVWRLFKDGAVDYNYNGIGTNDSGTWLLEDGKVTFKYSGVYKDENGDSWIVNRSAVQKNLTTVMLVDGAWRMVIDGKIDYNYEGIGKNNAGTWYVHEGTIDFKYNGSFSDDENTYLVEGNRVILSVPKGTNKVIQVNGVWRLFKDGAVDYNYNGIGTNDAGTWLLEDGKVTFKYSGVYKDENGDSWVVVRSAVQKNLTTVMLVDGAWRMVVDGKIEYDYEGFGKNDSGTWFIHEGTIDFKYNGVYCEGDKAYIIQGNRAILTLNKNENKIIKIDGQWKMFKDCKIADDYTGLGSNENGTFLVENGIVTLKYNGEYIDTDGSIYTIKNSKLTEVLNLAGHPGKMFIDTPENDKRYITNSIEIYGWALTDETGDTVKLYLDGKFVGTPLRIEREDVFKTYPNNEFGGKEKNPKPGFTYTLNITGLNAGNHVIKVEIVSEDGKTVIQSRERTFNTINLASKRFGIDVSSYQENIDWKAVRDSGVTFAIIRIGYYLESSGKTVVDPYFERNYNECKRLGIAVGGYFYSYAFNATEAMHEANACLSIIRGKSFEMPIFLDVEDNILKNAVSNGKTNVSELTNASITFCNAMNSNGFRGGVYASKNFFKTYLNTPILEQYNIWLAHYTESTDYTGKFDIWQYTSAGRLPGIFGNVDFDWCFTRYF